MTAILLVIGCLGGLWAGLSIPAGPSTVLTTTGVLAGTMVLVGALATSAEVSGAIAPYLGLVAVALASVAAGGSFVLAGRTNAADGEDDRP